MKYICCCFVLVYCLLLCPATVTAGDTTSLRELVVPISPDKWKRPAPKGTFSDEMRYMLRLNNRYTLNKWYKEIKHFQDQTGEYFDFGGKTEHFIRPAAHHALTLGICLKTGVYDPSVSYVSEQEATKTTVQLIRSIAYRHKANIGRGGWGDQWQSALWAARAAHAAWILWDELSASDQELVCRMTVHEADRFLDYKVPYYRDLAGNILSEGDTKAEENGWNSNILAVATVMMPGHSHYKGWMRKLVELQLSAYAMPEDTRKAIAVDGMVLNKVLNGSNMNSEGTVINHKIMHPDYMSAFMLNTINAWTYELAGKECLQSSLYNRSEERRVGKECRL